MSKKVATLDDHVKAFKDECLMLLRHYLAWKRLLQFEDIKTMSRTQMADIIISIKCIENDLIIRISKLDDKDKRVHSFQRAILLISNSVDKKNVSKKFEAFVSQIRGIKQKKRNEILAHLKIGNEDSYEPSLDLLPAIKTIIEITDLIAGNKINYNWSDGSFEKYDLRKELFQEK
jgi:hypothetical protein